MKQQILMMKLLILLLTIGHLVIMLCGEYNRKLEVFVTKII